MSGVRSSMEESVQGRKERGSPRGLQGVLPLRSWSSLLPRSRRWARCGTRDGVPQQEEPSREV